MGRYQVVTDWLGNTPSVAMRHYLMTTEEHFAAAVKGEPKAAQNAAQQVHAKARNTSQIVPTAHEKTPALPGFAGDCELLQSTEVAGTGFEPVVKRITEKDPERLGSGCVDRREPVVLSSREYPRQEITFLSPTFRRLLSSR